MSSVSNDWVGGIKPCGVVLALWYWVQSHCNLDTGKVRRCVLVVSYRCADALCICIVDWVVHISFDGLHSLTLILTRGRGMGLECIGYREIGNP